jgi:uncharacterized protein YegP (UPF0339 family)
MKIVVFQGADLQWYLRVQSSNNRVIADGGEGYKTQRNAQTAAQRLVDNMHRAKIVVR